MQSILRLALGSKHSWSVQQRWASFALEILTLGALMILCGDPHAAVNFALLLLLAAAWRSFNFLRHRRHCNQTQGIATAEADNVDAETLHLSSTDHDSARPTRYAAYVWLTSKIALQVAVVGLAAWQSSITLEWVAVSSRSSVTVEIQDSYDTAINSIIGEVKKNQTHSRFDFSLSPWNLPSIAMPTWAGHFQPDNSRWVQAIPSEGRMWMPSMYQGFLPLLFAFSAMFLFWLPGSQASIRNVLGVIALLSLLAAMGNYSIAWTLRSLFQLVHLDDLAQLLPGDDSGSLYGLLVSIVPGYDSFRYPAKWSVWFAACFALLAGMGLNCWPVERFAVNGNSSNRNTSAIFRRLGYLILAWMISLGAIITLGQVYREPLESWLRTYPDPLAGYPSYEASLRAVVRGVLHPAIILLLGLVAGKLWTLRHRLPKWLSDVEEDPKAGVTPAHRCAGVPARACLRGHQAAWLIVGLSIIDLASVSPQWLTTVESHTFFAEVDGGHFEILPKMAGPTRVWANTSRADISMISQASEPTMQDSLQLQQQFLQGKLGQIAGDNLNALHASGAIEPQATVALRRWLQRKDTLQSNQPELDQILAALGVSQRLVWQPSNGGGKLVWQNVKQAKPLCELVTLNDVETTKYNVHWRIEYVDDLVMEVYAEDDAVLVVRQLNDGSWKIEDAQMKPYPIAVSELWVTCRIGPGSHTLRLSRDK